jgi:hypothetical protein
MKRTILPKEVKQQATGKSYATTATTLDVR